jgi:hypothetical protein
MPAFDADTEPIYVFELEDLYLFKFYFDRRDIFSELQEYYTDEDYRFEVPKAAFSEVQELPESNYYEPVTVDDPAGFAVVKEQYTEHAEILRNAVMHWTREGHHFFVMQDPLSVDQAVEQGATRLENTDFVLGI